MGLSNDHTYLRPGKTNTDVRGVDFFVEAEELMHYLDKLDLEMVNDSPPSSVESTPLHRNLEDDFGEAGDDENHREINIVIETDYPDEYDALESEAESDDGASDSIGSLLVDEYTPDEDVSVEEEEENLEEPLFDEVLLHTIGGIANVASGIAETSNA
ncbi:Hypothetical protein PHPALM_10487 [Phytophthora palmivora]|uniref:Uncharacterized protein n=1 Tax=Phytophthora palmivora TaxID=4796 RepID=A0A2P4Y4K5_9STRA|nr:Hypothetical protein PHPALM_10487 [Phytophthora palmivora]